MTRRTHVAPLALVGLLMLAACGGEGGSDPDPAGPTSPASSASTSPPADDGGGSGGAASADAFLVNGDSWAIREIQLCETEGFFDIIAWGLDRIQFFLDIEDGTDDWDARINGSAVEDNYGETTIHENVSADYTRTDDLLEGTFVLGHPDVDDVTVEVSLPIPAAADPDCPLH